jgi:hypothetical protein
MINRTVLWRCFSFFAIFAIILASETAQAQLSSSLQLSKRQYLLGEPVMATVTVTNHAGRELVFTGDSRNPWLNFLLKDGRGDIVTARGKAVFGKMKIRPGESLARQVDLTQHFRLNESGNFSVGAVTNRMIFTQVAGIPYWKQKVGISGKVGQTREYRVINFSGEERAHLYAQVNDGRTGQNVRTFLLGDVLTLRKPLVTVDRQQRMHVMFLATPTMWVHCQVDTDGKLVNRQIHQRGSQGDPQLLTFGDGTVRVANSVPYDEKAAAEAKAKVRKASDRPAITY